MNNLSSVLSSIPPTANIYMETLIIIGIRIGYTVAAQRLLHTLNPTLRDITSDGTETPDGSSNARDIELSLSHSLASAGVPGAAYQDTPSGSRNNSITGASTLNASPRNNVMALHQSGTSTPYSDGYDSDPMTPSRVGTPDVEMAEPILRLNHGRPTGPSVKEIKERRQSTRRIGKVARLLFSICFAEACTLLSLVFAHEINLLNATTQFSISLHVLLFLVLLLLPFGQCLLFTYGSHSRSRSNTPGSSRLSLPARLLIAIIPYTLYIFLFTRLPPYITVHVDTDGDGVEDWASWAGWVAPAMGRLVLVGVVCLGGLSGFGAVRTAWMFYERSSTSDILTDETILQAERSLWRVRQDIASKESEAVPGGTRSWRSVFTGGGASSELAGLQHMERQAAQKLANMKQKRARQIFAQTVGGKMFNVVGKVFGVYCAARVLMCLPSLFLSTSAASPEPHSKGNSNGDWISYLLAFVLSHLPLPLIDVETVDIPVWSRAISLGFTGLIILSSLAQVLRSLRRGLKLTSKSIGAGFLLLTMGQLFATYIISLLTQLRATIPDDDDILANLPDFRIFGRLFDIVFLSAALGTLLYRFISMKVDM